jgi:hypothetical protein
MDTSTPETEPLPDESQDPALDLIDEQDHEFSREDMLALFEDPLAEDVSPDTVDEGGVDPEAGDDTPPAPVAEDDEGEGAPAEEPAPEPIAADTPPVINIGGAAYRTEDIEGLVQWVSSLSPEQLALLQTQAEPEPQPTAADLLPPEDELVDPRLAQWTAQQLSGVEQKLDILLEQQRQQQQFIAAQREAELHAALDTARRGVQEQYGLTDAEAEKLLEVAGKNPVATAAVQNGDMNTDPAGTFRAALETTYWITPEFRDRAIEQRVTTQVAELQVNNALEERKALNQSLVGQGAATPRATTPAPQTPQEHEAEALRLLRESMNAN